MSRGVATIYTDVSGTADNNTVSWCWIAILPNKEVLGPRTGRTLNNSGNKKHAEEIPKEKARKAMQNMGFELQILTDHPNHQKADEKTCDKRDPWHLVCHHAANACRLKGILREIKTKTR
jgi:hypothetical protein